MPRWTFRDAAVVVACGLPLVGILAFVATFLPQVWGSNRSLVRGLELVLIVAAPTLVLLGPLVGVGMMLRHRAYPALWLALLPALAFVVTFWLAADSDTDAALVDALGANGVTILAGAVIWVALLVYWFAVGRRRGGAGTADA